MSIDSPHDPENGLGAHQVFPPIPAAARALALEARAAPSGGARILAALDGGQA